MFQYEREFLIQLQFDDMSQIKPLNLPDMDIIKVNNEFVDS